jgi:hypothetical protein
MGKQRAMAVTRENRNIPMLGWCAWRLREWVYVTGVWKGVVMGG